MSERDAIAKQTRIRRRLDRRQWTGMPYAAPSVAVRGQWLPTISVVLPVYNHARYLGDAIDSTLTACDRYPLQLIVVNDGSRDNFADVVAPFRSHPRIVVIEQENAGIARALNAGFSLAVGALLTWTSADNRFHGGALDRLADYLIANPSVGMVYGNVQLIDETGAPLKESGYRRADQVAAPDGALFLPTVGHTLSIYADNFVNACFLYRRTVRDAVGEYDPELHGCEDYDYWLRIAAVAPISHIDSDDLLYDYRLHSDTLTAKLEQPTLRRDLTKILAVAQRRALRAHGTKSVAQFTELTPKKQTQSELTTIRTCLIEAMNQSGDFIVEQNNPSIGEDERPQLRIDLCSGKGDLRERSHIALAPALDPESGLLRKTAFDRLLLGPFDPVLALRRKGVSNGCLFPAPQSSPLLLRRARDSDFLAIEAAPGSFGVCGIFIEALDDSARSALQEKIIEPLLCDEAAVTVALLCSDPSERVVADAIFLNTPNPGRLRILDLSSESLNGDEFIRALTFVLSAIDVIVTGNPGKSSYGSLCRTIGLSRVAAAAGVSVVDFSDDTESRRAVESTRLRLERHIEQLPNVVRLSTGLLFSEVATLRAALDEVMKPVDRRSLEQLLEMSSPSAFLNFLVAMAE